MELAVTTGKAFQDLRPVVDARPITTRCYSLIVASMVKRRLMLSHLAYGSGVARMFHASRMLHANGTRAY
jgi:hypothetical protein